MKSRLIIAIAFLLWTGFVLAVFFIVQKPDVFAVSQGLMSLVETFLLAGLFILTAASIGYWSLSKLIHDLELTHRFFFSMGLGMGLFGLIGFGLASSGQAHPIILLTIMVVILLAAWRERIFNLLHADLRALAAQFNTSKSGAPQWIVWFALAMFCFTLLLALAPPVEAFDGLFYHLVVPSWWLRDNGLRLVNMPQYWFPSLAEGMFVWPLAFGKDSIPQLFHLLFGALSILLVWDWTSKLWGAKSAWWTLAIFLSMPSLPWLAAWAYADLALVFYSISALLCLHKYMSTSNPRWLTLCGLMTGFALGIKYTSFALPLAVIALIVWRQRKNLRTLTSSCGQLVSTCVLAASPWYVRNLAFTGNPFYPFIFGGPYWDSFRAQWYASTGTGIGWNLPALLSLPLTTTLGYRDANYYDGRIGPFFVVLIPFALWALWKNRKDRTDRRQTLGILTVFSALNLLFWTYGVVQTTRLWQARLLLPGLIPLIIPMALGIVSLEEIDFPKFRLSFVFSALFAFAVFAFLLDFGLLVVRRNPLAVALGMETRESYSSRLQPEYTQAVALVEKTPPDAYIYELNEPRSYGMNRRVQPDSINDNLPHDLYIYHDIAAVIRHWRGEGYTHILLARQSMGVDDPNRQASDPSFFAKVLQMETLLQRVSATPNGEYVLYKMPDQTSEPQLLVGPSFNRSGDHCAAQSH